MKIFIPSYQRAEKICTHLLLDPTPCCEYFIVLHDRKEKREYLKNKTIDPQRIIVSDQPKGIRFQRDFIKFQLNKPGDWFAFMDDNITAFTAFPEPYYSKETNNFKNNRNLVLRRKIEKNEIDIVDLQKKFKECVRKAEEIGVGYITFSPQSNWWFRSAKWRTVGYAINKMAISKVDKVKYDMNVRVIQDYALTAMNLARYGKLLINNYIYPVAGHYQKGGIGTYEERLPRKIIECKYLMDKYPEMFRYKQKAGCPPNAELQLRFFKEAQVQKWMEKYESA